MSDPVDTVAQAELPLELDLPEYHGRKPVGQRTSLQGAGTRIEREHPIGDRVVLVVEAKVKSAGHADTDNGLLYLETLKVVDQFEVEPHAASRLLAVMRQAARAQSDAGKRTPLAGSDGTDEVDMGAVGYTDASGVVLTPKELAEMRGDPAAAIIGDTRQVVVIYDDQSRLLWPDEYPADTVRPSVGDRDGDGASVAEVVDAQTGEPVDEFEVNTEQAQSEQAETEPPPIAEQHLPTSDDFAFVKAHGIAALTDELEDITELDHLERLLNAEKQGRGTGAPARAGAVKAIEARLDKVRHSVKLTPTKTKKGK